MAIPTHTGYAIITVDAAGKTTVTVAAAPPERGESGQVLAVHVGETTLKVHKEVPLTREGRVTWSTGPVQVYVDATGLVHVAPLTTVRAPV